MTTPQPPDPMNEMDEAKAHAIVMSCATPLELCSNGNCLAAGYYLLALKHERERTKALVEAAEEAAKVLDAIFDHGHELSRLKSEALIPHTHLQRILATHKETTRPASPDKSVEEEARAAVLIEDAPGPVSDEDKRIVDAIVASVAAFGQRMYERGREKAVTINIAPEVAEAVREIQKQEGEDEALLRECAETLHEIRIEIRAERVMNTKRFDGLGVKTSNLLDKLTARLQEKKP